MAGKNKKGALRRILRYVKPQLWLVVIALICAAASVLLSLYTTVLIGEAVDCITDLGADFTKMSPILIKIMVIIPLVAGFQWLMYFCTNAITHRTVKALRTDAFHQIQKIPLSYIDVNAHGDIISRVVNDVDAVSDGLLQGFQQLFTGVVTIVGTLCFMLSLNVEITLVVVLITPVSFAVAAVISKLCFN